MPKNPIRLSPPSNDGPWADQLHSNIVHGALYQCDADWTIPEYRIGYYGILLIVKGSGWMNINRNRHTLSPNVATLARPTDTISAGHDPSNPVSCYSIGFLLRTSAGDDLILRRNWPETFTMTPEQAREWCDLMIPLCENIRSRKTASQTIAHAQLILALDRLDQMLAQSPDSAKVYHTSPLHQTDTRLLDLIAHIDANPAANHTSRSLAKFIHVSPTHLAHLFRQHSLPTPMEFVRQRRIALASTLLSTTNEKIASIALQSGYPDPFHFSRVFKKAQGLSPEAYRSSCKNPFGS